MTKNAKARNGATEVKAPEVKENNVDPALVKEIDKELGVLADANMPARRTAAYGLAAGTQAGKRRPDCRTRQAGRGNRSSRRRRPVGRIAPWKKAGARLGSKENPLPDLTEGAKKEETEVASVYLDIPPPVGRRRYSKRREEYKDWPVGKARIFKNFKTNPVNAVLYPLVDDGYKFQSQKQEKGTEAGNGELHRLAGGVKEKGASAPFFIDKCFKFV